MLQSSKKELRQQRIEQALRDNLKKRKILKIKNCKKTRKNKKR